MTYNVFGGTLNLAQLKPTLYKQKWSDRLFLLLCQNYFWQLALASECMLLF